MRMAQENGTLVLLENLDPSFTSADVEVCLLIYIQNSVSTLQSAIYLCRFMLEKWKMRSQEFFGHVIYITMITSASL